MVPKFIFARGRWIALFLALLLVPSVMLAGTTGNLTGYVRNQKGDGIANARISVSSPALQGSQSATTDEEGFYRIFSLPPGVYVVTAEGPGYAKSRREGIVLLVDQTIRVDLALSPLGAPGTGEGDVIVITEQAPVVEQGSTTIGANLSGSFLQSVPTGRRITTVLNLTPGATNDQLGTAFLGSSSPENAFVIDGINTTGVDYGLSSTNLPVEFIDQIEVKTAGYGAEYGRATGAYVNTVLKSGGNEFHGDVFVYATPFEGARTTSTYSDNGGDPLGAQTELKYDFDAGFDVGGYVVKDKLWFFVGFVPSQRATTVTRTLGNDSRAYDTKRTTGYYVGKLTYRINEDNNVVLSVMGNPTSYTGPQGNTGVALAGTESYYMTDLIKTGQTDASLRINSKLNDDKMNVELLLGYHNEKDDEIPNGGSTDGETAAGYAINNEYAFLYQVPGEEGFLEGAAPDCGGRPCYVYGYRDGGNGYLETGNRTRLTGTARVTHYINNVAGNHKLMWGGDYELNTFQNLRQYTGTHLNRYAATGRWRERWFATEGATAQECTDLHGDNLQEAVQITDATGAPSTFACLLKTFPAETKTNNAAAFLQESWSILDNLTLNLGVRWEMQQIRDTEGEVNLGLYNNWAPRLGFIFDPTNEGKSKIFGSYGLYYEAIPMDINDRAFSLEGLAYYYKNADGSVRNMVPFGLANPLVLGGATTPIQEDIKPQYMNEYVLGLEYELLKNMSVSARYARRVLGGVIEDISPDDGSSYFIANPGTENISYYDPKTGEVALFYEGDTDGDGQCAVIYTPEYYGDPNASEEDRTVAVPCFPKAERVYQGLELSANKRMTDNWTILSSYVLSWTYGNYPGLFTPENGQLDPNITSQFDLADLMTNRYGFLPQDKRHVFKVHGSYDWEFGLKTGGGITLSSGTPISYLAAHPVYDEGEAFIAPRGSAGRTPGIATFDGDIEYGVPLGGGRELALELTALNIFNFQNALRVDQNYTYANAYEPVNGQSVEQALCEYDSSLDSDGVINRVDGSLAYCSEMKNPNFGQPVAYQDPLSIRIGAKFTF